MAPRALALVLAAAVGPGLLAQEPSGAGSPLTAPPAGVSLTGRWKLDPALSDDAGEKAREAMESRQSDGDHRRVPRPHFPDPGGFPGDPGEGVPTGPGVDVTTPGMTGPAAGDPFEKRGSSRSSGSQRRAALEHVVDLPEILTIAQRPALILIEEDDDEGRIRALRPDGIRVRSTDGRSESRTHWSKGLLHVETWHDDGVQTREVFDLAPDATRLTVTVHVNDGGAAITLERVFRPDKTNRG